MSKDTAVQCFFSVWKVLEEAERELEAFPWNSSRLKEDNEAFLKSFNFELAMEYGEGLMGLSVRDKAKATSYSPRGFNPTELYGEAVELVMDFALSEGGTGRGPMDPYISRLISLSGALTELRRRAEEIVPQSGEEKTLESMKADNRRKLERLLETERREDRAEDLRRILGDSELMASTNTSFHRVLSWALESYRRQANEETIEAYETMAKAVSICSGDPEAAERMESIVSRLEALLAEDRNGDAEVFPKSIHRIGAEAYLRALNMKLSGFDTKKTYCRVKEGATMNHKQLCPKCGKEYEGAMSRADSSVSVCPECGLREALEARTNYEKSKKTEGGL